MLSQRALLSSSELDSSFKPRVLVLPELPVYRAKINPASLQGLIKIKKKSSGEGIIKKALN